MIQVTDQQLQAVKHGDAIRLSVPEIGEEVVLLSASQYQSLCESAEDRNTQQRVLRYSMQQAAKIARQNPY